MVFLYFLGFLPPTPWTLKDPSIFLHRIRLLLSSLQRLTQHISPGSWGFLGFPFPVGRFVGAWFLGFLPPPRTGL